MTIFGRFTRPLSVALVACAFVLGCHDSRDEDPIEVPEPDLSALDAPAGTAILELRNSLASLTGDDLGTAYRGLGRLYYANGLQDAAEACFRNATRLNPSDAESIYFLALNDLEHGRLPDAVAHLQQVLRLREDYTAAWVRLGNARIELGDAGGGSGDLQRAIEREPFSAAVHYSLGKLAGGRGEHRAAIQHFQRVLDLQPEATRVHYPLAQAYRGIGDIESAERHVRSRGDGTVLFPDPWLEALQQFAPRADSLINSAGRAFLQGRFNDAVDAYRRSLESDPHNVEGLRGLALALERLGDVDGAIEALSQARSLRADDPEIERGLGLLLLYKGDGAQAVVHLRRAVELDRGSVDGHLALARALHAIGEFDESLQAFDQALAIDPLRRGARIDRAGLLFSRGQVDAALAELRAIAATDPDYDDARLRLAVLLAGAERGEEARAVLTELLDREMAGIQRARVLFNLGVLESARGAADRAHDHFRDAVAEDPDHTEALFFYAVGLARGERYAEAAEHFSRVVERQPSNVRARLAEATALIFSAQYERAWRRLEEGLTATPDNGQLQIAMAKLLAIAPDGRVRDGTQALALAQELYDERPTLEHAEVLAMAHAATGGFDRAATLQREIIARASEMGQTELVAQFQADLARYERGEPARSPWPGG